MRCDHDLLDVGERRAGMVDLVGHAGIWQGLPVGGRWPTGRRPAGEAKQLGK